MSLTLLQREVMTWLRANRSTSSWVSGSVVLATLLSRTSADIDLHHLLEAARDEAILSDTALLTKHGFAQTQRRESPDEVYVSFRRGQDLIAIEWVLLAEANRFPLVDDAEFGMRSDLRDVVLTKLLMIGEGDDGKHFLDLVDLGEGGVQLGGLVEIASRIQSRLRPADFAHAVHVGIRSAGVKIARHRTLGEQRGV